MRAILRAPAATRAVADTAAPPRGRPTVRRWIARALSAPIAIALVLRLGLAVAAPVRPVWDGVIYARGADFLAHGLGFTRTVLDPDQPAEATAFYPVGFPAMLAPLRWLRAGRGLDLAAQSLAGTLLVLGAGVLGRRAGGPRVARGAAWLVALWPGGILLSASWLSEPFFALFVVAAALVVGYARRRTTLRATAIAALILGAGAYVRPTAMPILVSCTLGLAWWSVRPWGASASSRSARPPLARGLVVGAHAALAIGIASTLLAPWTARNALALDGPALVSTNGGANLLVGTRREGDYAPIPEGLDCRGALPEVARDRCRAELALGRIAEAPLDWLARGVLKTTHTFGHESAPAQAFARALRVPVERRGEKRAWRSAALWALALERGFWVPFLAAALAGAVIVVRGRRAGTATIALLAPIAGLAALHFVFLGGDRYHAPVVPMLAVLAAIALESARRLRRDARPSCAA